MVFGLACAAVAVYCGWDASHPGARAEDYIYIWMNWAGAVFFGIGAVYCFVLATKRSKQPKADSADSESDRPPESGA
jgi:hypothetical protein